MSKSITSPLLSFLQEREIFSLAMLRILGYGLISMALIDFTSLLIPPRFMNPLWEFQTVGSMIEKMPIVLLGFVFVFFGEKSDRTPIETFLLRWLSWLALIFAIFLFITFPLSIINGFRIYYNNNAQVNLQIGTRVETLNQFQTELEAAESLNQIASVLQKQTNNPVKIPKSVDTEELKTNILDSLSDNQKQLKQQAASIRSNKGKALIEQGLKWNLGALISAFILFFIWQQTYWARLKYDLDDD